MLPDGLRPWGFHSLQLELPLTSVQFTGLSALQCAALEKNYAGFIAAHDSRAPFVQCHAYRLDQGPVISRDELICNGQYAPRKQRLLTDGLMELTGINFVAQIAMDTSSPSSLGVVQEQEFAQPNVCENFLRVMLAHAAVERGGAILHSAGIVSGGCAYIFQGYSNAGKTTLTRKAYAGGARVLSDDINLLLPHEGSFRAHAVPFTGEFGRTLDHPGGRESYPVAGIILLEQGEELKTQRVGFSSAVSRLLTGCPFVNTDEQASDALFDAVTAMVETLPVIKLYSRLDDGIDDIMAHVRRSLGPHT